MNNAPKNQQTNSIGIKKKKIKNTLPWIYLLAIIGDLTASTLITSMIILATFFGASQSTVGWLGSAYGLSYLFMPGLLGRFGDKYSRKKMLILSLIGQILIVSGFLYLLITFNTSEQFVKDCIFLLIMLGVFSGLYWPNIEAFISESAESKEFIKNNEKLSSSQRHEKAIARFCLAWSIGYGLGPWLGGILVDIKPNFITYILIVSYLFALYIVISKIKDKKNINKKNNTFNEKYFKHKNENESKNRIMNGFGDNYKKNIHNKREISQNNRIEKKTNGNVNLYNEFNYKKNSKNLVIIVGTLNIS